MTEEHLDLSYVGMLKKFRGIGMTEDMRGDMLIKAFEADAGDHLLDAMDGHILTTGITWEKVRKNR